MGLSHTFSRGILTLFALFMLIFMRADHRRKPVTQTAIDSFFAAAMRCKVKRHQEKGIVTYITNFHAGILRQMHYHGINKSTMNHAVIATGSLP
jgi:D-alanyl-lipoteichoic acid acyltransferase DltB (MBOAT superfamily)